MDKPAIGIDLLAPGVQRQREIWSILETDWTKRWHATATLYRQSQANWTHPCKQALQTLIQMTKESISKVTHMITGHNYLKYFQNVIEEIDDPTCRLCREDSESSIHILDKCPMLSHKRMKILGHYISLVDGEQKPQCLLALLRFFTMVLETINGTQINLTLLLHWPEAR